MTIDALRPGTALTRWVGPDVQMLHRGLQEMGQNAALVSKVRPNLAMMSQNWLELLMARASLEALDRHRRDLLDSGVDADVVELEARRAVQLYADLSDCARRAAELTTLSEMAGRLASVQDLEGLLSDIAIQARQLLRTDVAYLALVEGEVLRVRFADGTTAASIRDVNLPMTEGLAGRIFTSGCSDKTIDYLADARIVRNADADKLAQDEELHAILGAPLRAGGVTVGVLFAAERRPRSFAKSEETLLAGLAGHAAVAIENARLFDAVRTAADRAVAEATTRNRGEILSALLERGDTDTEALTRRARYANIDLSKEHLLAVAAVKDGHGRDDCIQLARRCNGLVTERAGVTVVLVPHTAGIEDLAAHATVGVSSVVGAVAVPGAYVAARQVLRALLALGKHDLVADAGALGVYRFLLAGAATGDAAEFVQRTVGSLLDHDRDHGSDLAATVEEYLASGRRHKATAKVLHMHPNTLYLHLGRVGAILGADWCQPDRMLDILVALRFHRLAETLGHD